jgi:catechol 2,3-dioxygenase-like lactoylglutathione lyase family enzyme
MEPDQAAEVDKSGARSECRGQTQHGAKLAAFYERVLGLQPVHVEPDFWVFEVPDGRHVEVFGALSNGDLGHAAVPHGHQWKIVPGLKNRL